jgi:uncharacterized protein YggT (Ycf19 family)
MTCFALSTFARWGLAYFFSTFLLLNSSFEYIFYRRFWYTFREISITKCQKKIDQIILQYTKILLKMFIRIKPEKNHDFSPL